MEFEAWFKKRHPKIKFEVLTQVSNYIKSSWSPGYIAKYKAHEIGQIDEISIREILESRRLWYQIAKQKKLILHQLEKLEILNLDLRNIVESFFSMEELEAFYAPYKKWNKSQAKLAKEAGLENLAKWIWDYCHNLIDSKAGKTLEQHCEAYLNPNKNITSVEEVLKGAKNLLIERLAQNLSLIQSSQEELLKNAELFVEKIETKPESKHEGKHEKNRYTRQIGKAGRKISLDHCQRTENSALIILLLEGQKKGYLKLKLQTAQNTAQNYEEKLLEIFEQFACTSHHDSKEAALLKEAAKIALFSKVLPRLQSEFIKKIRTLAEKNLIYIFRKNLRKQIMTAPFGEHALASLFIEKSTNTDNTSGKYYISILNKDGSRLAHKIFEGESFEKIKAELSKYLLTMIQRHELKALVLPASAEASQMEKYWKSFFDEKNLRLIITVLPTNESIIYSKSRVSHEEFKELEAGIKTAISLGRRFQDPLEELLKIDVKRIQLGQHQHELDDKLLRRSLTAIICQCVNSLGTDLNHASAARLSYVSGLSRDLAAAIIRHRTVNGPFKKINELLNIPEIDEVLFKQCAGFLRIHDGLESLDATGIHPEHYALVHQAFEEQKKNISRCAGQKAQFLRRSEILKTALNSHEINQVIHEIESAKHDPRGHFRAFQFSEEISKLEDLKVDMLLPGIVRNVSAFGAFVDIGLSEHGLIHLSEISKHFTQDARKVLSPGDSIKVKVLKVNIEKKQFALSLKFNDFHKKQKTDYKKSAQKNKNKRPEKTQKKTKAFSHNPFADLNKLI